MSTDRIPASRGIASLTDIPEGECRHGPPELVNGRLQNVQIFDAALSASEVAALVPEPSTLVGCAVALGSLGMHRFRRRRARCWA
jgi:hypothetical protein